MILTLRTYGLLGVGLGVALLYAVLVPNANLAIAAWGLIGFDGLILILAFWDQRQVLSHRITIERHHLDRLSIGRDNPVTLQVSSSEPATIQIRDAYPPTLQVSAPLLRSQLNQQDQQELGYTVHPHQRGAFNWGDIHIQQLSPGGLAWHRWRVPAAQTVAVYPDLIGLRSLSIKLALQSTGRIRQAKRMGMGTEFAELREYATGDDPRLIDWKATARRNRLLVKVLEPEQEQTLLILLDRGRLMTAQVQGVTRFDWGLNATLSLALAGIHRGDRVGIAVFDRQIQTWIPPQRGQQHFNHCLERLTPIQPDFLEPDYMGVVSTLLTQQHRRALVVLITDIVDKTASSELLSAMGRLVPRYLPFSVLLRDPLMDQQAKLDATQVLDAYNRAVAIDLLKQRDAAIAQLKHQGSLVLDAPATQVAQDIVDQYLRIKARSQL
jgi:uncharacterized protein (DUF58 family)